jgi:hypothetical protein
MGNSVAGMRNFAVSTLSSAFVADGGPNTRLRLLCRDKIRDKGLITSRSRSTRLNCRERFLSDRVMPQICPLPYRESYNYRVYTTKS